MRFESKKDWWLRLLIWIPIGGGLVLSLMSGGLIIKIVMIFSALSIAWIWFGTYYEFLDDMMVVKCGPFSERIKLSDIKSVKETRNPLSSAALSIDRLELRYGFSGMVLVSPKDKEAFIEMILNHNSGLIVKKG